MPIIHGFRQYFPYYFFILFGSQHHLCQIATLTPTRSIVAIYCVNLTNLKVVYSSIFQGPQVSIPYDFQFLAEKKGHFDNLVVLNFNAVFKHLFLKENSFNYYRKKHTY